MDFTEADVMEELRELGYANIPKDKLGEFMSDLRQLMQHERSQTDTEDFSLASSAADDSSDGLARYPQHTDFHWGTKQQRQNRNGNQDVSFSSADTPRSAFEKSKVPLNENSFFTESFGDRRTDNWDPRERTSPKRFVRTERRLLEDESVLSSASSSANNSIVVKRKTLRRTADGKPRDISTEEVTLVEDEDDLATLDGNENAALEELPHDFDDDEVDYELRAMTRHVASRRPRSAGSESSTSSSQGGPLPSFIRPLPEVRRRRHDPVNRYHQYNDAWSNQRAPGEKHHKALRWAVREQMQRREEIITPIQRYYVPNDFVPPTDKKRQNLRWEIRTKLAHKQNPSKPTAFNVWM